MSQNNIPSNKLGAGEFVQQVNDNTICRQLIIPLGICGHNSLFVGKIGDWTWDVVHRLCAVNPYRAYNQNNAPTYLAFFYYHICGNAHTHLKKFVIGDEIEILSSLYRCQDRESLHTIHRIRLLADIESKADVVDVDTMYKNPDKNSLYIETFNRWVSRVEADSNEKLVKAAPQGIKIDHLPKMSSKNPPWKFYHPAIKEHTFLTDTHTYKLQTSKEGHRGYYSININRDINGVGLLYFANYFTIIDEAILEVWLSLGGDKDSFLERKITNQKICYLGNADYKSELITNTKAWQQEMPESYVFNVVISLKSEKKVIAVCTIEMLLQQN